MVKSVSSWEELPPGTWLEDDEHGNHWYLDDEGNRWYSKNDAYLMVEVESNASAIDEVVEKTPTGELTAINNGDKETLNLNTSKKRPILISFTLVGLLLAGIAGYFVYDYYSEPDFYGEVYWADSGHGYLFEEDQMKEVYPLVNGDCSAWYDEFLEFTYVEENGFCTRIMAVSNYQTEFLNGNEYEICSNDDLGKFCAEVYVLPEGIVYKSLLSCEIMINGIGSSSVTPEVYESHIPSLIINGNIRFGVDDPWTNKFLRIAEDIYAEMNGLDCSFPQFESTAPRVLFGTSETTSNGSVGDPLFGLVVEATESKVPYSDVQFFISSATGNFECNLITRVFVPLDSEGNGSWVNVGDEDSACVVLLYDFEDDDEWYPHLSVGDFLVVEQVNNQICAESCDYMVNIQYQEQSLRTLELTIPYQS
ncbi:MAG: hypothetical protein ACPHUK_06455 [Candidatus Poseidoniaceae archaeon]